MAKSTWNTLISGKEINTGDNSQIRASLVETTDGAITGIVNVRKWAKYVNAVDRAAGLTKDTVPFRPTQDGLGFPASIIPQVITDLQKIYDFAVKNGMATYDPTLTPVENTARATRPAPTAEKTPPTKRKKVM